jgi:hypothetical protein
VDSVDLTEAITTVPLRLIGDDEKTNEPLEMRRKQNEDKILHHRSTHDELPGRRL